MTLLKSTYLTENDLRDCGFKSLGKNVRISSDARIYGQQHISIGDDVRIDDFAILSAANGFIEIGNHVFIARNCHLSGTMGLRIHDFVTLAGNVTIYSASDDYSGESLTGQAIPPQYTKLSGGLVELHKHVILGTGTTVIGPANLKEGSGTGAMSLVVGDLDAWWLYAGIPAKSLREKSRMALEHEVNFLKDHHA
ncbi:MAG: acyltransferase [Flavobacteriales bacterium]|jgi:acetyltransferase-like isoleucine patch superfamily enzyme